MFLRTIAISQEINWKISMCNVIKDIVNSEPTKQFVTDGLVASTYHIKLNPIAKICIEANEKVQSNSALDDYLTSSFTSYIECDDKIYRRSKCMGIDNKTVNQKIDELRKWWNNG